jgi:putative ATP-binding cassette transporter
MSTATNANGQKPSEALPDTEPKRSFREQLRSIRPYWVSDQKWKARLQLAGILALIVAEIALTAGVSLGFQAALNALVAKQAASFALAGGATLAGIGAATMATTGREYMTLMLSHNWRKWLTGKLSDAWLSGKSYLRLQHSKRFSQHPDQRIAETVGNVTGSTLGLGLGLFRSVIGIATFSVMLWHIAPVMVGAALACATVAHIATTKIGKSMRKSWKFLADAEAKFRHALARVRNNAKPIALAGLEPVEKETLREGFDNIDKGRREFYKLNWRTGLVNSFNINSSSIVPIALSAPKFFAGTATLGGLELARQAYGQFYSALCWFPQGYAQITNWSASVGQMMDFQKDLEENKSDITTPLPKLPAAAPTPELSAAPNPKSTPGPKP